MSQHALHRTSRKGLPFIGTCFKCGRKGLNLIEMRKECPNTRSYSEDEMLLEVVSETRLSKHRQKRLATTLPEE